MNELRERLLESTAPEDRGLAELIRLVQSDRPTTRAIDRVARSAARQTKRRSAGVRRTTIGAACIAALAALIAMHPAARERIEPDSRALEPEPVVAGTSLPTTPAGAQLSRWLEVFNSATRKTLLAYHEQHFPYQVASEDVGSPEREYGLSVHTGGFTVKQVERSEPTKLVGLLLERAHPQFARVRIEVAAKAPHGVTRFEIHPIPTPPRFLSQDERALRSVDAKRRKSVLEVLGRELEAHYIFLDVAQKMSATLRARASRGEYDELTDATELARVLSDDLRQVSGDKHLSVGFGRLPPPPPAPPPLSEAPPPWIVAQNYGFGPQSRLGENVAVLTINGFVPLLGKAVESEIGARMSEAADADAVLIDLRDNHGGVPDTVAFIASYFFEGKPRLLSSIYRRDTDQTSEFWTRQELPGTRFGASKPVYVLTSGRTFSGGEDLAYTLQAHKRAIVVGEVTGGGAHPTEPHALDDGLFVALPWGRSINPVTKSNWEGSGVQPDVPSSSDVAPRYALEHLAARKPRLAK